MPGLSRDDVGALRQATAVDSSGATVGPVTAVYADADTDLPEWALVGDRFVPLVAAELTGSTLLLPYPRELVASAPHAPTDAELSRNAEAQLYAHYGLSYDRSRSDSGLPGGPGRGPDDEGTDAAITRSEERLEVGLERVETGRARLRKYVVAEDVEQTVPVTREEIRIERIQLAAADRSVPAVRGLAAEVFEIILTAEEPVVSKQAVPVERIRLGKETLTETVEVREELRKERIDVEETSLEARVDPADRPAY